MNQTLNAATLCAAGLLTWSAQAAQAQSIQLSGTKIGPELIVIEPDGGTSLSVTGCSDVSDLGLVVGKTVLGGSTVHFEWTRPGGFHFPSHLPPGGERRVNNFGDSVVPGTGGTTDLILADGTRVPIDDPLGTVTPVHNRDLNDDLLVIGQGVPTGTSSSLFFWTPLQGSQAVLIPSGKQFNRVNRVGQAVGNVVLHGTDSRAFFVDLSTGNSIDLADLLPGSGGSEAIDVNDHGLVTGFGPDGTSLSAFVWSEDSGFTFLPGLGGGLSLDVRPTAIDNRGTVVGSALTAEGDHHAFLWSRATGMLDLNELVPSGDFQLVEARDISETGVIIGRGFHGPVWGPNRGFILTLHVPVEAR